MAPQMPALQTIVRQFSCGALVIEFAGYPVRLRQLQLSALLAEEVDELSLIASLVR